MLHVRVAAIHWLILSVSSNLPLDEVHEGERCRPAPLRDVCGHAAPGQHGRRLTLQGCACFAAKLTKVSESSISGTRWGMSRSVADLGVCFTRKDR